METYDKSMAPGFRSTLMERAEQLRAILMHETAAAPADPVHEVGDFKDAAAQESIASVDEAQAAHAALELRQIQDALARLKDGSYGECLDCGDPIDLRRLRAMPSTAFCAACQDVRERR